MDPQSLNVVTAPKTATFQMRINPEIKQQVESVYARQGLNLTDAVNLFIQQSLNENGLPFLPSPENETYMRAKAARRLIAEAEKGWASVHSASDWVSEEEAYRRLEAQE